MGSGLKDALPYHGLNLIPEIRIFSPQDFISRGGSSLSPKYGFYLLRILSPRIDLQARIELYWCCLSYAPLVIAPAVHM